MKSETKVILCLLGLLIALEVGARFFETRLSKDIQHVRELPAQAQRLHDAPAGSFKVLILGNSLARCGIVIERLTQGLEQKLQQKVVVSKMHPDGSRIEEWAYGYRRYFAETASQPDVILMTTGLYHLSDRLQNITGMGAFFVSSGDAWEFCQNRLSGIEAISRFIGARYSALWAHRDRVEPLFFYKAIPGYAETAQEINSQVSVDRQGYSVERSKGTCDVFLQFAEGLKVSGTRVIIASVPMPETYELPDEIVQAIQKSGASFLNLGSTLKLPAERFPDQYHLDVEGAALFTRQILDQWPVKTKP